MSPPVHSHTDRYHSMLPVSNRSTILLWDAVLGRDLIAQAVVLIAEALTLLLEGLNVLIALSQLLLQATNLACVASLAQTRRCLAAGTCLIAPDLLLEAKGVENHDVCSVEDEREEESETTQVHVALRVELACLNLHALAAGHHAADVSVYRSGASQDELHLRRGLAALRRSQLHLHAIDTVDAVDKQDQDEDEGDLCHIRIPFRHRSAANSPSFHIAAWRSADSLR